jgi:hypothetical protein
VDLSAVAIFAAMCLAGAALLAVGIWKGNPAALLVAILLFVAAPFLFGLRVRM